MARKAKEVTIYSNYLDEVTTTVPQFCEEYELTPTNRKALYSKEGWVDEYGTRWKVGEAPRIQRRFLKDEDHHLYNMMETSLLAHYKKGDEKMVEEITKGMKQWQSLFFFHDKHKMTNLDEVGVEGPVVINSKWEHWSVTPFNRGDKTRTDLINRDVQKLTTLLEDVGVSYSAG